MITRLELIDHTKEGWVSSDAESRRMFVILSEHISVTTDVQDEGRTLKVFINDRSC